MDGVKEFRREDRYIVIKRSDMEKAPADLRRSFSGQCRKLHEAMLTNGAPARSFVVVEDDWPEYNFVWLMLEHRMGGYPVPDFNAVKCAADVQVAQYELAALREENADALAVNRTLNVQMDALREELAQKTEAYQGAHMMCTDLKASLTAAAPVVERQPVAWRHTMHFGDGCGYRFELTDSSESPFGKPDVDYDKSFSVTCEPLHTSPPAPVAVPDKYDDVLLPFLALMRSELHANAHKGDRPGWLQMDSKTAILEVFYHMGKLHQAVHRGEEAAIKEYAADVANMCMMLLDVCACLDKLKELNT